MYKMGRLLQKCGHSRSLKVVLFESLCTVSYSASIVTMAVSLAISEIFSVKEWPDLEIWVWGRSRSLKIIPFESLCTVSYSHSIVSMAVSLAVSEIFSVKNGLTLKSRFGVIQGR